MTDTASLCRDIAAVTGIDLATAHWQSVSGGDINAAWQLELSHSRRFFLKLNRPETLPMFAAEMEGLAEIAASQTLQVPTALGAAAAAGHAWLLLEWLPLAPPGAESAALLGRQLAAMHQHTAPEFGWHRDNTIGLAEQQNERCADWVEFFRERRLRVQLQLAEFSGAAASVIDTGQRLLEQLGAFFTTYQPAPSLLHGDLWGGNWSALADGTPVIFDPAVYYGDREADIAMTRLFGGFGESFYAEYEAAWPLDAGYREREDLYNLYHILNHYNLFGGGYMGQAESMMQRLLAQT